MFLCLEQHSDSASGPVLFACSVFCQHTCKTLLSPSTSFPYLVNLGEAPRLGCRAEGSFSAYVSVCYFCNKTGLLVDVSSRQVRREARDGYTGPVGRRGRQNSGQVSEAVVLDVRTEPELE